MKPLEPWPTHKHTKITDAQILMVRDGAKRATLAGWTEREWVVDCAALLGCTPGYLVEVIAKRARKFAKR